LLQASLKAMLGASVDEHIVATAPAGSFEALCHLLTQPIPGGETARLGVSIVYQYAAAGITQPAVAQLLTETRRCAEDAATHEVRVLAPQLRDRRRVARSLIATADGLALPVLTGGLSANAA